MALNHGSESSPLSSLSISSSSYESNLTELRNNPYFYVKKGGSVSISVPSYCSVGRVDSGYGISIASNYKSASGTLSKAGTCWIVVEGEKDSQFVGLTFVIYSIGDASDNFSATASVSNSSPYVGSSVSIYATPVSGYKIESIDYAITNSDGISTPSFTYGSTRASASVTALKATTVTIALCVTKFSYGGTSYSSNIWLNNVTLNISNPPTYSFTLRYNANGGSGAPSSQSTTSSSTASRSFTISSTIPTRKGYRFLGWSTNSNATSPSYQPGGTISVSYNSTVTLYAVWKKACNVWIKLDSGWKEGETLYVKTDSGWKESDGAKVKINDTTWRE